MKKIFVSLFLLLIALTSLSQFTNEASAQTASECVEILPPTPVQFEKRIGWLTQLMATFQWQETSEGHWQLFMDINPIGGQETWVSSYPHGWAFRKPVVLPSTIVENKCSDPTPDPCEVTDDLSSEVMANPCSTPSPTPSATPTPNVVPSPEPQNNDLRMTFNCTENRWNAEVVLKKNNQPVNNAKIDYQFYGKQETRYSDSSGINNFGFSDEGKGLLKVYIDSFNGHEVELNAPECTANAGEPQTITVRGRVLGASTEPLVYADTGSASTVAAQVAFALSIIASGVAYNFARRSQNA